MSQFASGHRGTVFLRLITGLVAAFVGMGTVFSSSHVASAQIAPGQMNAAVSIGLFEELVKPTPIPTATPKPMPSPTPAPKPAVLESGVASTYGEGDGFEGNLTACGQVFHTDIVQVAHKSLPCGTVLRIEDLDTGRSVTAQVTDRGPYIRGRIVDLSWGAFRQLDSTGPGLLNVNIYILER
jgi:rare lipoprotein A (peptidoglycan hydrolase)